jgi:hypothetical protein
VVLALAVVGVGEEVVVGGEMVRLKRVSESSIALPIPLLVDPTVTIAGTWPVCGAPKVLDLRIIVQAARVDSRDLRRLRRIASVISHPRRFAGLLS